MKLKTLVKNVKNYIKMSTKGEAFIELFDVEDNSVIFEVPTIDDIQVGVPASPDGEFIFSDGMKVVIEGGLVTVLEKPVIEEKPEEVVETIEGKTKGEGEEINIEEMPEDEKDKKIAELEQTVSDLKEQVEKLQKDVTEKEDVIEEAEKELEEIKNFYTELNKSNISGRKGNEEGVVFSYKKK